MRRALRALGSERQREREKTKKVRLTRNRYHYMLLGRKDRGPSPFVAMPTLSSEGVLT